MAEKPDLIEAVWEKGRAMPDTDRTEWRQDQCGAWIHREQLDNPDSDFGWRILNVAAGGEQVVDNLVPFHYENGFDIASGKPHCRVKADRTALMPGQRVDHPRNRRDQ